MSKMCPSCHLCMTCSDSSPNHDCKYPDCDKWHQCPNRTPESNSSAKSRARSARDSEAESSERDME